MRLSSSRAEPKIEPRGGGDGRSHLARTGAEEASLALAIHNSLQPAQQTPRQAKQPKQPKQPAAAAGTTRAASAAAAATSGALTPNADWRCLACGYINYAKYRNAWCGGRDAAAREDMRRMKLEPFGCGRPKPPPKPPAGHTPPPGAVAAASAADATVGARRRGAPTVAAPTAAAASGGALEAAMRAVTVNETGNHRGGGGGGAAAAAVARRGGGGARGERGERASGGGGGGDVGEVCCLICEEAPLQIRFSCGHATCCRGCLPAVMGHAGGLCPICRAPIDLGASVALKAGSKEQGQTFVAPGQLPTASPRRNGGQAGRGGRGGRGAPAGAAAPTAAGRGTAASGRGGRGGRGA